MCEFLTSALAALEQPQLQHVAVFRSTTSTLRAATSLAPIYTKNRLVPVQSRSSVRGVQYQEPVVRVHTIDLKRLVYVKGIVDSQVEL